MVALRSPLLVVEYEIDFLKERSFRLAPPLGKDTVSNCATPDLWLFQYFGIDFRALCG